MNIIDLVTRKAKKLANAENMKIKKVAWQGEAWRAVEVRESDAPQIVISGISDVYRLRARPFEIGWYACSRSGATQATVDLVDGEVVSSRTIQIGEAPTPITIAWPLDGRQLTDTLRLEVHFSIQSGGFVDLLVHRVLNREPLISLAKGVGVEIGPGPNPQIKSASDVSVKYVEEMSIEKWTELYDANGKYGAVSADWSNYIIGKADNIPVDPESLDFIFCSHVFEHLSNPLGHILRWKNLLKPGGVILAVVPDMNSTKDYNSKPSTYAALISEMDEGIWEPNVNHYRAFSDIRGGKLNISGLMEAKSSIHVHFYNKDNISYILDRCVKEFDFSGFNLIHADNHKDFHFMLWK